MAAGVVRRRRNTPQRGTTGTTGTFWGVPAGFRGIPSHDPRHHSLKNTQMIKLWMVWGCRQLRKPTHSEIWCIRLYDIVVVILGLCWFEWCLMPSEKTSQSNIGVKPSNLIPLLHVFRFVTQHYCILPWKTCGCQYEVWVLFEVL